MGTPFGPGGPGHPGATETGDQGGDGGSEGGAGSESADDTSDGLLFDLGAMLDIAPDPPQHDACKVSDDMNAIGVCDDQAPPMSFDPVVQWSFSAPGAISSKATPLVANLTDDNGDGVVDLCDIPDVVLVTSDLMQSENEINVLSGSDGSLHFKISHDVATWGTPALGDIDDDGPVEIVALENDGAIVAFEHDGTFKWRVATTWGTVALQLSGVIFDLDRGASVAIANLDNSGLPEIIIGNQIISGDGGTPLVLPDVSGALSATTAADFDGDGDLEVILGHAAYHHDGSLLWDSGLDPGFPQIGDLDGDGQPEVLLTNELGIALIEHDGSVTYSSQTPIAAAGQINSGGTAWLRPATIHDFDGDGDPEFALGARFAGSDTGFAVYEVDGTVVWNTLVTDSSGVSGGTAFDFLGDGRAEAVYSDEVSMFVFGEQGETLLDIPRTSTTITEYPVVVDVDNDGSAEILFVSNVVDYEQYDDAAPTLQVIADASDRWIQARRIWNQHSYHVTNVREDGTIPTFEPPSWQGLNTFRTNAQIQDGALCDPVPAG